MKEKVETLFVGDVFIQKNSPSLSENLKKVFSGKDIISCNFEGPLSLAKQTQIKKVGPYISQNVYSVKILHNYGFNLFNLANNHIMDYGIESLEETISRLPKNSFLGAGIKFDQAYKPVIKNFKGFKIGFLSFSEWGFGVLDEDKEFGYAWINHSCVDELVEKTKNKVDFLVIQAHAGVENIDLPLPEWRKRYMDLIDKGADLIIGHHPHVPQGWEEYRRKKIFYSLGNFYMDQSKKTIERSFVVSVSFNPEIKFEIIPIIRNGNSVDLLNDDSYKKYLFTLSKRIARKEYIKEINELSCKLWKERYRNFYMRSLNTLSLNVNLVQNLKAIKNILFGKQIDESFILHNMGIESHRYLVERYLKLKLNKSD